MKKLIKIALVVSLGLTSLNADMCMYYIKQSNMNMELANSSSGSERQYNIKRAIKLAIKAKYSCPDSVKETLTERIEQLKEVL